MINYMMNKRHKSFRSIKRMALLPLVAMLLTTLLSCSGNSVVSEAPALLEPVGAQLEAAVVTRGTVSTTTIHDGSVIPETIEFSFDVDGRIKQVNSFIGEDVTAGDVLIEIESINQDEIKRNEEELTNLLAAWDHEQQILAWQVELAELELQRLVASQASTGERESQSLNISELKLLQTQAEKRHELRRSQIERKLADLTVDEERLQLVAPLDGKVVYLPGFAEGDTIQAYETIVVLADESSLLIRSSFVSEYYFDTAVAVQARIAGQDYDLTPHELDWETYMTIVLNDGISYTYYSFSDYEADELPESVEAGLYVPVSLTTTESLETLRIPVNCIYREGKSRYVYVIEDNERVRRDVEVGLVNTSFAEITEGLEEGERVYIHD